MVTQGNGDRPYIRGLLRTVLVGAKDSGEPTKDIYKAQLLPTHRGDRFISPYLKPLGQLLKRPPKTHTKNITVAFLLKKKSAEKNHSRTR